MSTNSHFPRLGLRPLQARLSTLTLRSWRSYIGTRARAESSELFTGFQSPSPSSAARYYAEMIFRFRKHLSQNPGPMRTTYDTLKHVLGINSRPQLQELFQISILQATISKLQSFIGTLMRTLTSTDISEVSNLFTDYEKPTLYHSHAPTFKTITRSSTMRKANSRKRKIATHVLRLNRPWISAVTVTVVVGFTSLVAIVPSRNSFDLSHFCFQAGKIGRLQTLSVIPTLPGDSISININETLALLVLDVALSLMLLWTCSRFMFLTGTFIRVVARKFVASSHS